MRKLFHSVVSMFSWAQRSRQVRQAMDDRKQIVINETTTAKVRRNMIERQLLGEE